VRLPVGYDPRKVRIWFDRARTRFFYWLIPESNEYAVAGLVAETAESARHLLDEFLVRQRLTALNYQGAMIPLHQPFRQIEWRKGAARALLVGDAAAHVKVTTVGGLVSGLWGANAAAQSILDGTSYWREIAGLHKELYLHDLIRWLMDRFSDDDYDQMLLALGPKLKTFLAQRNRDSMALAPLALLAAQPSLALLAGRAVLGHAPAVTRPTTSKRVEALSSE
jgi:flavin-dependent dehydrogenase